jgi:hypothetical protein
MLEKLIWTEADYDIMGWHDATVWALALGWESHEFSLDIDYIKWVQPDADDPDFRFWVAPATLVFHNTYQLNDDGGRAGDERNLTSQGTGRQRVL